MPGPMSAPNGDRSLTVGTQFACEIHGPKIENCTKAKIEAIAKQKPQPKCEKLTKREYLLRRNRLYTGKSRG